MTRPFAQDPPNEATIAAYLSDRLDAADAEAFEDYCLRHPDFARGVELDLLFKVGLRQMQRSDPAPRSTTRWRIGLALAAGLALAVGCGLLLLPRLHPATLLAYRSTTEVPAALLSGPRMSITLIRLRGGSDVHRVIATQRTGLLTVRVAPDSPPGRLGYAAGVELESRVLPKSMSLDDLHPNAEGYIQMYLPLAAVLERTVKITVNPAPAMGAEPLSFRLQVTYADPAAVPAHD